MISGTVLICSLLLLSVMLIMRCFGNVVSFNAVLLSVLLFLGGILLLALGVVGVYSPVPFVTNEELSQMIAIEQRVVDQLKKEGINYSGKVLHWSQKEQENRRPCRRC